MVFIRSVTAATFIKINLEDPKNKKLGSDKGKHWAYPHTKCVNWMIVNALSKRLEDSLLEGRV